MKFLGAVIKAIKYSILDEIVERGGIKLDVFSEDVLWHERPTIIWIGDFSITNGSIVGVNQELVFVARKRKPPSVAISIGDLLPNRDTREGSWNRSNRPYMLRDLKLGFGERVDRYIDERKRIAQQAAP
jgi:hypothetical protein